MEPSSKSRLSDILAPQIPKPVLFVIVALSLVPILGILLGFDFGSYLNMASVEQLGALPNEDRLHNLYRLMAGPELHTLFESSAIVIAVLTALLAFSQYNLSGNMAAPVIGVSLLCAGAMDTFHILASARLIDSVASGEVLEPFSWAVARTVHAIILLFGVSLLVFFKRKLAHKKPLPTVAGIAALFILLGYVFISWSINTDFILTVIYPHELVIRPFDTIPLVLYVSCAAFALPKLKKHYPSVFADALILSMLPAVAAELHMVFGSDSPFDSHYFSAHFLKILSYAVPFIGLLLDYLVTYKKDQLKTAQLHQTYREIEERTLQLTRTNKDLERSNRYKSEFLASMSHELRTPLNSIIGFSRVLIKELNGESSSRAVRAVEAVERNGLHLQNLVTDILDLSKMDAGVMPVNISEFSLAELIDGLVSELAPLAEKKFLDFQLMSYARNLSLSSDKTKVKQMLLNLGTNAIKYTHKGSVTILVEQEKNGRLGRAVKIVFKDTGIGISHTEKDRLFTEFGRADEVQKAGIEGTGLGLMITAKLASLLGGYLEFESEYGVGSEFRLLLPLGDADNGSVTINDMHWDRKGLAVAYFGTSSSTPDEIRRMFASDDMTLLAESRAAAFIDRCEETMPDLIFFEVENLAQAKHLLGQIYERNLLAEIPKLGLACDKAMAKHFADEGADFCLQELEFSHAQSQELYKQCVRDYSAILVVGALPSHEGQLQSEFEGLGLVPQFVHTTAQALEAIEALEVDLLVINLGNASLETTRLLVSLSNDEHSRRIPQVLFNGTESVRKAMFSNETQEEIFLAAPSITEVFAAAFTMRRRSKTSLMRIEALNRSLHEKSEVKPVDLPVTETLENSADEFRVLVVEDSKDCSQLIEWILNDAGCAHDTVESGRDAIKQVLQVHYGLILLDIDLPDLSGIEVTRRLRATSRYKNTPIVAVTALNSGNRAQELRASGIDETLRKPVDQEALMKIVDQYMPAKRK